MSKLTVRKQELKTEAKAKGMKAAKAQLCCAVHSEQSFAHTALNG